MDNKIQEELTTVIKAISSNTKIETIFLYKKLSLPLDLVIAKKSVFERRSKLLTLESIIAKRGVCIYGN